jgi:hypothetical protein
VLISRRRKRKEKKIRSFSGENKVCLARVNRMNTRESSERRMWSLEKEILNLTQNSIFNGSDHLHLHLHLHLLLDKNDMKEYWFCFFKS